MKLTLFIGGLLGLVTVPFWGVTHSAPETPEVAAQTLFLRSYVRVAKPEVVPARDAVQCDYEAFDLLSSEYDLNLQGASLCAAKTSCGTQFNKVIYHGDGSYVYWTADPFELILAEVCAEDLKSDLVEDALNRVQQGG